MKRRKNDSQSRERYQKRESLRALNVRPSRSRGQNFLLDKDVIQSIAAFGQVPAGAQVVEIGPGTGELTEFLAKHENLTLIDIEPTFCEHLRAKYPHARVINADVRSFDLTTLGEELYVFGNIPYVFSTEIVFHLLAHRRVVKQAVLMVQKEFAERLAAAPGGREYGSITVSVGLWSSIELGPIVPGTAFHPPTEVTSRVFRISFHNEPHYPVSDYDAFQRVVRAAFAQRRKKIVNSLISTGFWSKEHVVEALEQAGISRDVRAECLSLEDFFKLYKAFYPA
jgi:16S rRNA (adenine1518-N6/adenine1519-N6)-dimethyltransferase